MPSEKLLSDEAVEAAAKTQWERDEISDPRFWEPWIEASPREQEEYREDVRAVFRAALSVQAQPPKGEGEQRAFTEELEERCERLQEVREGYVTQLDALRRALRRFGRHSPLCATSTREEACDCGLREAFALTTPGIVEGLVMGRTALQHSPEDEGA